MYVINFTTSEILKLIKLNVELPNFLKTLDVKDNKIKVVINPSKLPLYATLYIKFHSFSDGILKFILETHLPVKMILKILDKIIRKKNISEFISFQDNYVHLSINRFLSTKIKGILIKSIKETNRGFEICFQ